jgi:hypothetical protein
MSSTVFPLLRPRSVTEDVAIFQPCYVEISGDTNTVPNVGPVSEVYKHLRYQTSSDERSTGHVDPMARTKYGFAAGVRLPYAGSIAMTLQGVVGWSDPSTVEELHQLFNRDQIAFWGLVDYYRKFAHQQAIRKWKEFERMEKEMFDERSAFMAMEDRRGKWEIPSCEAYEAIKKKSLEEEVDEGEETEGEGDDEEDMDVESSTDDEQDEQDDQGQETDAEGEAADVILVFGRSPVDINHANTLHCDKVASVLVRYTEVKMTMFMTSCCSGHWMETTAFQALWGLACTAVISQTVVRNVVPNQYRGGCTRGTGGPTASNIY